MFSKLLKKIIFLMCVASSTAQATDGIFVSLETGPATQSGLPAAESVGATSLDNNSPMSLRAAIGYNHDIYSFLGLGMESALGKYGNSVYHYENGGSTTIKTQTLEFLALVTAHIQKFDLIGKVGGARQETDVTGENAPATAHHNNPEAGIELAYNFTKRFAATASYSRIYGGTPQTINDISVKSVSVNEYLFGLRYTFAS
jgi:hypothetical protein